MRGPRGSVWGLVILASVCLSGASESQDWSGLPAKAPSVFRLEVGAGDDRTFCSTVLINAQYRNRDSDQRSYGPVVAAVYTAGHCVPANPVGRSLAVDGRHAEIARVNYVMDLAILTVDGLDGRAAVLRTKPATIGTPIAVVGFAFAGKLAKYTFGWIADVADESVTVGTLFDVTIIPGHSGSAILDGDGALISIAQGWIGYRGLGGLAVGSVANGVPPQRLKDFAKGFWPEPSKP